MSTTDPVLGEFGRFPLWINTEFRAGQYWVRCSVGEAPELVMEAMDLSKVMAMNNYRSWYMKIHAIISNDTKSVLYKTGMPPWK